jgi:putative NADH-flavin reductase
MMQTDVVTGAFGYSGAVIARGLLAAGHQVRTLTGHPDRAGDQTEIDVRPLDFADADALERDLRGAHTLYNTYWMRFSRAGATRAAAVANSRVLLDAAARAGISRISREEYQSMAEGLCDSDAPSTGSTSVSDWIAEHGHELGRSYDNQLTRHYRG